MRQTDPHRETGARMAGRRLRYGLVSMHDTLLRILRIRPTPIAAAVLVRRPGTPWLLLSVSRRGTDQPALPGGKYDPESDSTPLQTAVRELMEETGVQMLSAELLGVLRDRDSDGRLVYKVYVYEAVGPIVPSDVYDLFAEVEVEAGSKVSWVPQRIDGGWWGPSGELVRDSFVGRWP